MRCEPSAPQGDLYAQGESVRSDGLVDCYACGALCHPLADGSPCCQLHLPPESVPSSTEQTPPPDSTATSADDVFTAPEPVPCRKKDRR